MTYDYNPQDAYVRANEDLLRNEQEVMRLGREDYEKWYWKAVVEIAKNKLEMF